MAILDQFTEVLETPYRRAQVWKESHGTKLLGCGPMHLPEEMVHAAGVTPVVLQPGREPITLGHSYFYSFFCGYVRGTMDLFLKGSFNFVDGVAFPDTCLQMRGLCSILRDKWQSYLEFVQLPADVRKPDALPVTLKALKAFQKSLEEWTGRRISREALKGSILLYNESRSLMRQFYQLCHERPGLLRPREVQAVALSSLLWPREDQKALLTSLLKELEGHRPSALGKARLLLSGHLCHAPQAEVLDLVEKAGGVVVNDDLYAGYRSIASDVAPDGNPLEALGRRYLANFPPCPTRSDNESDWGRYLVESARRSHAQGVVVLLVKFCEPHIFYYPHLRHALEAAKIPHLVLETEHELTALEAERTRLQAFVEMIGKS